MNESNQRPLLVGESHKLIPGHNVDPVNVAAGLAELKSFYPDASAETIMVIEYALMRWKRGEEQAAEKGACDESFHGIDFGSWRRVLAAAVAGAS